MRFPRLGAVAVVGVLLLASCGDSSAEDPPTTAAAEELVTQAHTRVFTELFARDERVDGPEAHLPLAAELTTGRLLQRIQDQVAETIRTGVLFVGPGYESNIVEVVVDGDTATVLDCSRDTSEGYSLLGKLVRPADDFFELRQSALVLIDGVWFVEDIAAGGEGQCDPSDGP